MQPDAETSYLFRHATVRDAAYQLLPVSQRSRLHGLALDILEETTLGLGLDSVLDLADHAGLAQVGVTLAGGDLPFRELRYLRLAAVNAASKYANELAARLWERVAEHSSASADERVEAFAEAGLLHWMMGRRKPALKCLSRGIELSEDDTQKAFCLIERGCLYRDVRDNAAATRDLEQALELARGAGDKRLQLRAHGNLCTVRDESLTQASVLELYVPVLKLAREVDDLRAVGITEGQIGLACMRSQNWKDSENHLLESIRLLREAGDALNECTMLSSLGTLYHERTDGDRRLNLMRAVQYQRDALNLKEESGFLFQKSEPLVGLASANREMGMLHEAERWANEALRVSMEVGDPVSIGHAYLQLGLIHEAAGDSTTAERTLTYGFLAVEDADTDSVKVSLLSALARLLAGQGAWEDAQNHAQNAVTLSATAPDTRTRTRTRQLLRAIEERKLSG
ncbi:MAG: hypothetical protein K8I27_02870 [Planctomycetes bacterium]|nr:hypothetical protein [Planctomycetota bacterium]